MSEVSERATALFQRGERTARAGIDAAIERAERTAYAAGFRDGLRLSAEDADEIAGRYFPPFAPERKDLVDAIQRLVAQRVWEARAAERARAAF